jgi:hypothetical protein
MHLRKNITLFTLCACTELEIMHFVALNVWETVVNRRGKIKNI